MKKTKIFTMALLLAALVVSCSKDEETTTQVVTQPQKGYLKLFANNIGGNSKVSIDPEYPLEPAEWIDEDNELVMLNGNEYKIKEFEDSESGDYFYGLVDPSTDLFIEPLNDEMVALYPGGIFNGNDVEIQNGNEIVMRRLKVKFMNGDRQSMAFPMVATSNANADRLYFQHISGGVVVWLQNSLGSNVNIASLTIVAQSKDSQVENLHITAPNNEEYYARWAVEGPWVPLDYVGQNGDDPIDVKYSSVMHFDIEDGEHDTPYKTIVDGGELKFCVPITISSMKYLKVTGYGVNGEVLFHVHKAFASDNVIVESNRMYTFPVIDIR